MRQDNFVVLMAEDNEHDVLATKRAWKKHKILNPLYVVENGEDCLDYLHNRGKYVDPQEAPRPRLLLLDINMPKLDGISVLERIRNDPDLRYLPVVMLTTSKAEEDKLASYSLGVNAYIQKPVGFDNFAKAVKNINLFWALVEVPPSGPKHEEM